MTKQCTPFSNGWICPKTKFLAAAIILSSIDSGWILSFATIIYYHPSSMDRFWAWPPEGAAISTEVCFSESFGDLHSLVVVVIALWVQTHQLLFLCNHGGTMQPLLCSSLLPASSFVAYGCQLLPTTGLNVQPSLLYSTGRPANSVVAVRALFGVGSKPKAVRQVVKLLLLFSCFLGVFLGRLVC